MNEDKIGLHKKDSNEIWIETYTGKFVNPLKLKENDIDIVDIAHSLSLICRFNGHCKQFYSVAEHSIRVSGILEGTDNQLTGLLHDATESYMADITRPVKWALPQINVVESKINIAIHKKFNLHGDWKLIKEADNILLATEARDLMKTQGKEWYLPNKPLEYKIVPMEDWNAEANFLRMFELLSNRRY